MRLPICLLASALIATPVASAQEMMRGDPETQPAWYERFTFDFEESGVPQTSLDLTEDARSFSWGENSRWSVNFNLISRSVESPLPREEMSAGARYNFTPRFSIGGQVSVGANELDDSSKWTEQDIEAGVKLETSLKF